MLVLDKSELHNNSLLYLPKLYSHDTDKNVFSKPNLFFDIAKKGNHFLILLYHFSQFGRHASQRALHVTFDPGFNFFSIYLIFFVEKKKKKGGIVLNSKGVDSSS